MSSFKEVLLEKNHATNEWNRRWYIHHNDIVEQVDCNAFRVCSFPDVSKYDCMGCL